MIRWVLGACVMASSLAACASTETFTASTRDYDLYRRTRTAQTTEKRLSASHDYLEREPSGRFQDEVRHWFERAEPLYYARASRSVAGLRQYLDALPNGPHAKAAADKLADVAQTQRLERARDERLLDEARDVEATLAGADELRRRAVRELSEWIERLAAIHSWGQPTGELDSDTIHHFRLQEPEGHCKDERCVKTLALPFAVPDGKKLAPRKALFDVELELYRGGVAKARIRGPELWNRAAEASEVRVVGPGSAQARAEAIARAVQIANGALGARFGDPSCRREAVSPVVLLRECAGVRITMSAAPTPEEDDELVVEPLTPRESGQH